MTWALINADDSWASGPLDDEPTPGAGQRVVEVALGFPGTCTWDQERGGFLDKPVPAAPTAMEILVGHLHDQGTITSEIAAAILAAV